MAYFPMFVDVSEKKCLIVGGGEVALRKAKAMLGFGAIVSVVAPEIIKEIKGMDSITYYETKIQLEDIKNYDIVITATDDNILNHKISALCREKKIPVNSVDNIEDCSFIFPAYIMQKDVVAAFSSGGKCPVISQYLKKEMEKVMPDCIGDINEYMGDIRENIKNLTDTAFVRKEIYKEILSLGIKIQGVPKMAEVEDIVRKNINDI